MKSEYTYDGSRTFNIKKVKTDETSLCNNREIAEKRMQENEQELDELQQKLYAEKKRRTDYSFSGHGRRR